MLIRNGLAKSRCVRELSGSFGITIRYLVKKIENREDGKTNGTSSTKHHEIWYNFDDFLYTFFKLSSSILILVLNFSATVSPKMLLSARLSEERAGLLFGTVTPRWDVSFTTLGEPGRTASTVESNPT